MADLNGLQWKLVNYKPHPVYIAVLSCMYFVEGLIHSYWAQVNKNVDVLMWIRSEITLQTP